MQGTTPNATYATTTPTTTPTAGFDLTVSLWLTSLGPSIDPRRKTHPNVQQGHQRQCHDPSRSYHRLDDTRLRLLEPPVGEDSARQHRTAAYLLFVCGNRVLTEGTTKVRLVSRNKHRGDALAVGQGRKEGRKEGTNDGTNNGTKEVVNDTRTIAPPP